MKTDIAYIYALIDPRDDSVRYIGKTVDPKGRKSGHITECAKKYKNYRLNWIRSLLSKGLRPNMKILKICPLSEFSKYESFYINKYQSDLLTNGDDTGSGYNNRKREIIDRAAEKISRSVYQFDLNGIFLKEWKSTREASRNLNVSHGNVSRCCNGVFNHCGGFIFRYERNCKIESITNPNAAKKIVIEVDENGDPLSSWKCLMDCSRETGIDNGNLSRVCNGILKSIRGRYFRFD